MSISTNNLIDILEIAMNTCSIQNKSCEGCKKIEACIDLWERACEQSFHHCLTPVELKAYIEEFNQFIDERKAGCKKTK